MSTTATPTRTPRIHIAPMPTAITIDGAWRIGQNNIATGTPWTLTHIPTGWTSEYATRADIGQWLARPETYQAAAMAGVVVPYDSTVDVLYRCLCSGYLTTVTGRMKHVDACEYCYDVDGPQGVCDDVDRHVTCLRPAAAQCGHLTCVVIADPSVKCEHGHKHSCGSHGC